MTRRQIVERFKRFLRRRWPAPGLRIRVLYQHIVVTGPKGFVGFGAYVPEWTRAYVGGRAPGLLEVIAHEYKHHMQHIAHKRFSERDAEQFASEAVGAFRARRGR